MDPDEKKYNIYENIIQKVNQKYIALQDDEVKRNNRLLLVIDKIIQRMRSKSVLFNSLYQNKYYGGSYYDGLKVGKACEYDLDCVLKLPKIVEAVVVESDKPGYVHVALKNLEALRRKVDEASKYEGLEKLLDDNLLCAKKVRGWMESLMTSVWENKIDDINLKMTKSGPALTIVMKGVSQGHSFEIDVDVVPCFTFFDNKWPGGGYRSNPSKDKNTFFVVPKTPTLEQVHYWRLSFQEQERELITDYRVMKPTIKLLKKIRDRYKDTKIASYFIKTVFLWELEKVDKKLWEKSLSFVFITMLRKYADYIADKCIPYYWNDAYNLIGDVPDSTTDCIANRIRNILKEIDRNCFYQPYHIVTYILEKEEYNREVFEQEVPLPKKFLKQLQSCKKECVVVVNEMEVEEKSGDNLVVTEVTEVEKCEDRVTSTPSSVSSSFEEISKEMVAESESSPSKLETLITTLCSEQKRIANLLETAIEKIDDLDHKVRQLRQEMDVKMVEESRERSELVKMVMMLSKKVDELVKNDSRRLEDGIFVPVDDMLKRTSEYFGK